MNEEELKAKMLAFVDQQDNDICDEWWCTPRTLYADIMKEFATHLGIDFAVPYKEKTPLPDIDRNKVMQELLPEVQKIFGITYAAYIEEKK